MTFSRWLPDGFFDWCQNEIIGHWISTSTWPFAIIETIHIMGLTMILGTILVIDLRMMGFQMRRQVISKLVKELAPWTWFGLLLMAVTGIPLFLSEPNRMGRSTPFFVKMVILTVAVLLQVVIYRKARKPGVTEVAFPVKLAAGLSVVCWIGVMLAGRAIAFLGIGV